MTRYAAALALMAIAATTACGTSNRRDVVEPPTMFDGGDLDIQVIRDELICRQDGQSICAMPMAPGGQACFDVQNDPRHCGSDCRDCTALPGVVADRAMCRMGVCQIREACQLGKGFCDGSPLEMGCSVDFTTTTNCGACTRACAEPTPSCSLVESMGTMAYQCTAGCMGMTPDRCNGNCTSKLTDVMNCGACGTMCTAPPNSRATCVNGACSSECSPGFFDCDMDPTNGCEVDGRTSTDNCGRCRNTCRSASNGMPACRMGVCGIACTGGFLNCDGNDANGCEINGASNTSNCGMCGNACPAGSGAAATCTGGMCVGGCMRGFADCDSNTGNGCETNIATSVMTCGGCDMRCPTTLPNGTPVCNEGMCGVRCNAGYADCDSNPMNGCEVRIEADSMNCGRCGNACTTGMNQVATCNMGTCAVVCATGFTDCDGNPTTGCEANLQSGPTTCGTCGTMCVGRTNAPPACVTGTCRFVCGTGFADCNRNMDDGCEVNVASSINDCGTCGTMCRGATNAAAACLGGVCDITCAENFANCNANTSDGCETPTQSNVNNCGGCGRICLDGAHGTKACRMGACDFNCEAGYGNCDGNVANGCEAQLNTTTNCGRCGNMCMTPPGAVATCSAMGACQYACATGFTDCDMDTSNGCEARPGMMCPM